MISKMMKALFLFSALASLPGSAADLLCYFSFNGSGTSAPSTAGTLNASLQLRDPAENPADRRAAAGSGVSGETNDKALDNSDALFMGSGGKGGYAYLDYTAFPTMDSWSVSIWFKANSTPKDFARLAIFSSGPNFYFFPDAALTASPYAFGGDASTTAQFTQTNQWTFVAFSYDGTKSTDNLKIYRGSRSNPVTLLSTTSLASHSEQSPFWNLYIGGNKPDQDQPFDGLLDNFRMHGGTGTNGVATLAELEALRANDAGSVPPPPENLPISLTQIGDQLRLDWRGKTGKTYQIRTSTDLKTWANQGTQITGTNGPMFATWPRPAADPDRYYRLKITQ